MSSISKLEADAERQGISLNSLVQRTIVRYADWDRYSENAYMASFLPNVLDAVLEFIDGETAGRMGSRVVETSCFKDAALMIFGHYDLDTFLQLVALMDRFGNNYKMQEVESDSEIAISLYHNYGKKWSMFMGTILHGELIRLSVKHDYDLSENAIVLKFDSRLRHPEHKS